MEKSEKSLLGAAIGAIISTLLAWEFWTQDIGMIALALAGGAVAGFISANGSAIFKWIIYEDKQPASVQGIKKAPIRAVPITQKPAPSDKGSTRGLARFFHNFIRSLFFASLALTLALSALMFSANLLKPLGMMWILALVVPMSLIIIFLGASSSRLFWSGLDEKIIRSIWGLGPEALEDFDGLYARLPFGQIQINIWKSCFRYFWRALLRSILALLIFGGLAYASQYLF